MQWLLTKLGLRSKVPYRELKMGLIKEYSIIIPKSECEKYLAQGWKEAADFRDFHYYPNETETVMLTRPVTLSEIDVSNLVGQKITAFSTQYGSYGMGGPGFLGLVLSNQPSEHKVMIYAVWGAAQYTLLDAREIECHPRFYDKRHPWLSFFADEDIPNWDELSPVLIGCRIEKIDLAQDRFALHLVQNNHSHLMEFVRNDGRLPDQGNGEPRRNAFNEDTISDYIVFQREDAVLWV